MTETSRQNPLFSREIPSELGGAPLKAADTTQSNIPEPFEDSDDDEFVTPGSSAMSQMSNVQDLAPVQHSSSGVTPSESEEDEPPSEKTDDENQATACDDEVRSTGSPKTLDLYHTVYRRIPTSTVEFPVPNQCKNFVFWVFVKVGFSSSIIAAFNYNKVVDAKELAVGWSSMSAFAQSDEKKSLVTERHIFDLGTSRDGSGLKATEEFIERVMHAVDAIVGDYKLSDLVVLQTPRWMHHVEEICKNRDIIHVMENGD